MGEERITEESIDAEFKAVQDEYYRTMIVEMRDDCETYKKATECHEYAKLMTSYFQKFKEGITAYEENCYLRDAGQSCHNAASLYLSGVKKVNHPDQYEIVPDVEKAVGLLEKACNGNHPKSCSTLAKLLQYGQITAKDYKRAFDNLVIGCENGNTESCTGLAHAYMQGMGTKKDVSKAAELYEEGCKSGSAQCCHNMGVLYYQGIGVEKNLNKFKEFNIKAQLFRGQASPDKISNNPLKSSNLRL